MSVIPFLLPRAATMAAVAGVQVAACGGAPAPPEPASPQATAAPAPVARSAPAPTAADARDRGAASAPIAGDELTALKQELAQLRRDVDDLRRLVGRGPANVAAADPPDPRTDAGARAEIALARMQRASELESDFRREPFNAVSSRIEAQQIVAALDAAGGGLQQQVASVECRARSCRIEFDADAGPRLGSVLPMLVAHLPPGMAGGAVGAQRDLGNGRQASVVYLLRAPAASPLPG